MVFLNCQDAATTKDGVLGELYHLLRDYTARLPWAQPWVLSWVLPWVQPWCSLGCCLGCSLGRRRALWEISPSWDGRGSPLHAGSVGRSSIIFFSLLFGRGSSGGLGLFLLPGGLPLGLGAGCACFIGFFNRKYFLKTFGELDVIQKQHEGQRRAPQSDDLAFEVCQPEAQVSQGDGAPNGHEVPVIGAGLHDGAHAALQRYLGQDVVPQIAVLPDLLGPRKTPVHGTRGTTGSEGCLLLYSAVGNSLIFPISAGR